MEKSAMKWPSLMAKKRTKYVLMNKKSLVRISPCFAWCNCDLVNQGCAL